MMDKAFYIIADDMTGACDSGVAFSSEGTRVILPLSISYQNDADIIVLNTDTRQKAPDTVQEALRSLLRMYGVGKCSHVFKKIDSTMRGHILPEIDVLLDECEKHCAVLAPSSPLTGRTVRNGVVYVDGLSLADTEIGRDPFNPVREARILEDTKRRSEVAYITLDEIRKGKCHFIDAVHDNMVAGKRYLVCDAITFEDLQIISTLINDPSLLLCGSAGLASMIAHHVSHANPLLQKTDSPQSSRVLVVVGSLMARSRDQLQDVSRTFKAPVKAVRTDSGFCMGMAVERQIQDLSAEICAEDSQVVCLTTHSERIEPEGDTLFMAHTIAQTLAAIVHIVLEQSRFDTLLIVGGGTASALLAALGIDELIIRKELAAGIPWMTTTLSERILHVITKSGSFGSSSCLSELITEILIGNEEK